MSFVDSPKRGYSHPPLNFHPLSSPTNPPASGQLATGSKNVDVTDANYAALVILPTTGTNGDVLTIKRTSVLPVTVDFVNSDLGEPIALGLGEIVRYMRTPAGWVWLHPQIAAPVVTVNSVAPTATTIGQVGDVWVQTVDGTAATPTLASWGYNGLAWTQLTQTAETTVARQPVTSAVTVRNYRGAVAASSGSWLTTAQVDATAIAAMKFVGVGTAAASVYTTGLWQNRGIFLLDSPMPVAGAFPADSPLFDVPVNYVRHEVPIVPAVDNQYILSVAADRVAMLTAWVCDPVSGVPAKRLAATSVCCSNNGKHTTLQLTALGEIGTDNSFLEHIGFTIPKAMITAYKTATDTIKLALVSAAGNSTGNAIFPNSYAMVEDKFAATYVTAYGMQNRINGGNNAGLTLGALVDGLPTSTIAVSGSVDYIRVPLVELDRDVYLSFVSNSGVNGATTHNADTTIVSPNGNLALYRPKPTLKAPLAVMTVADIGGGHDVTGWVITKQQLKKYAVTPVNSAVPYLQLAIKNTSASDNIVICAIITEAVA